MNDILSDLIIVYLWSAECTIIKHSCVLYKKEYINICMNITTFLKTVKGYCYCFLS